ncbi:hypothetical protein N7490_000735 [Penicillium lividum]|nr:hypothetical protein N7490_000735 [Penicillium lividum]
MSLAYALLSEDINFKTVPEEAQPRFGARFKRFRIILSPDLHPIRAGAACSQKLSVAGTVRSQATGKEVERNPANFRRWSFLSDLQL